MLPVEFGGALIVASSIASYFAHQFGAKVKDHCEPQDEERRVHMEEWQRVRGRKVPSR